MMHLNELAYITIGSAKLDEWRSYAADILGAMVEDGPNGVVHIKLDEWHYRIRIVPHGEERFLASGWGVINAAAYRAALAHAQASGLALAEGTPDECRERMVAAFFRFTDPANNPHEVCWGRAMDSKPFLSPVGLLGFVTGRLGMGHVVLPCTGDYDAALKFYEAVMGLEYSDYFERSPGPGAPLRRVFFFHCCNARQHSLAVGEFSAPGGLNHFMVEVPTIDDVGRCIDRVRKGPNKLARSLGRHVNDSILSFYIVTPSGFLTEYGSGGRVMDWSDHEVCQISSGTYWGHEWAPGVLSAAASVTGASSTIRNEETEFRKAIPA